MGGPHKYSDFIDFLDFSMVGPHKTMGVTPNIEEGLGGRLGIFMTRNELYQIRGHQKKVHYWPVKWASFVRAFQNFVFELLKHARTIPQNNNFLNLT